MNKQTKAIILKETIPSLKSKNYWLLILFDISLFTALGYMYSGPYIGNSNSNMGIEVLFMLLPSVAVLSTGLALIQPMFHDEKILRVLDSILATPISIIQLWTGKMISHNTTNSPFSFHYSYIIMCCLEYTGIKSFLYLNVRKLVFSTSYKSPIWFRIHNVSLMDKFKIFPTTLRRPINVHRPRNIYPTIIRL